MGDDSGKQLINFIKKRKRDEALELLKHKVDHAVTDQSGRTALHFAAAEGYDEILEKLILAGAEVECWDNSGQTPIHKAAREGHVKAMVILIAHGALINTMDWRGCPPIELALINHHLRTTETLFRFGAFLHHRHWDWMNKKDLNIKEEKMKEMVLRELPRIPGFKYGGIGWKLVYVDAKGNIDLTDLKMIATPQSHVRRPFYLYCCRMQSEYAPAESLLLAEDDNPFSDVYEIRNWKMMKMTFTFTIIVEGQPKLNEDVVLAASDVNMGNLELVDISDTDETTHVTLSMTLITDEVAAFTLCLRERSPETYIISNEALKINPKSDDSASIDIPEGTFETPAAMSVQITNSKPKTNDRRSSIRTNLWNMELDDKFRNHSNEPMEINLHIHLPPGASEDMAFINTSSENPDDEDDWHVIDGYTKTSKGVKITCTFNRRVSIGGVSKKMLSENKKQVTEELNKYRKNIHEVVFIVMTKLQDIQHNVFSLMVDCGTPTEADRNRNRWLREGYDKEQRSKIISVKNFQEFRISYKKNQGTPVYLTFQAHRKSHNYRMSEFTLSGKRNSMCFDDIIIDLVTLTQPEAVVEVVKSSGCCSVKQNKFVLPKPFREFKHLCSLPVFVKFPPVYKGLESNQGTYDDLEEDDECMISVLRYTSLKALAAALTLSDGKHIASQLKISQPVYYEIMKNENDDHQKVFQILATWRGNQPYIAMVDNLIYSLRSCNRHKLADDVAVAARLNNVLRSVPDVAQNK